MDNGFSRNYLLRTKGSTLVEVILSLALFSGMVLTYTGALGFATNSATNVGLRQRGLLLAEEGLEAARSLRENGLDTLIAGTYGLASGPSGWSLVANPDQHGVLTRSISIADVDARTKTVDSTVTSTLGKRPISITLRTTLTDWPLLLQAPSPESALCRPPKKK